MLRRLCLVTAITVVPVKDFDPLVEGRVLGMREDGLNSLLYARGLAGWNNRFLCGLFKYLGWMRGGL